MGMNIVVAGGVSGQMLAGAMIRAQAFTPGDLAAKQRAGVGHLSKYLGENYARAEAWNKGVVAAFGRLIPPGAVIARASLNGKWLGAAGTIIENTTDVEQRRILLGQVIDPHLGSVPILFDVPFEFVKEGRISKVDASQLKKILRPELPAIPLELIEIKAGKFMMGSTERPNEQPIRKVSLSTYRIGKYKVTNGQYGIFMSQTGYGEPSFWNDSRFGKERSRNPLVGADWNAEEAFLSWPALRHLTEAEWEYAARGPKGLIYPWGNKWNPSRAPFFGKNGPEPVDAHRKGASWCGVMGMAGNVRERVADWYADKYDPNDLIDPQGPKSGTYRVLRGDNSWNDSLPGGLRGSQRSYRDPAARDSDVGFRVAEDIK